MSFKVGDKVEMRFNNEPTAFGEVVGLDYKDATYPVAVKEYATDYVYSFTVEGKHFELQDFITLFKYEHKEASNTEAEEVKKAIDFMKAPATIVLPQPAAAVLGMRNIMISDDVAKIAESGDYSTLLDIRTTLEFLVDQFGGEATWKEKK